MKEKFVRFSCWAFVLLMLLSTLAACSNRKNSEDSDGETQQTAPPASESSEIVTNFTVEMLSTMKIVYAHGASDEIATKADELKNVIKSIYGVELLVASDYLREGSSIYKEVSNEILLGETNRAADDAYYAAIRYEDYGYTTAGGKIIIGGGNTQATLKAISDFAFHIVTMKKGGADIFFTPEFSAEYQFDYTATEILLNGVSCQEYRIVYPENSTHFEEQLAIHVASNLQNLVGYRPDIVSDANTYTNGYEILIGKTNRNDALYTTATNEFEGCIVADGKFIAAYGDSALGNTVAVTELTTRIQSSVVDKKVDLKISNADIVSESETVSTMTYNVYAGEVSAERSARVSELIWRYMPDVIGVQEGAPEWMLVFDKQFSQYYARVGEGAFSGSVGSHNSILYSKERFELLETKTKWLSNTPDKVSKVESATTERILTYALLKDRVTNETICFVNTHLDYVPVPRMQQTKFVFEILLECGMEDYPVVLMGDMNCRMGSEPTKYMMALGLTSANNLAEFSDGMPEIDFIMVSEDCIDVSYARVCNESIQGEIPSDHPATYAEFTVNMPEGGIDHDFREPLPVFPNGWLDVERDESDLFGELTPAPPPNVPLPEDTPKQPDGGVEEDPSVQDGLQIDPDEAETDFGQLNRIP